MKTLLNIIWVVFAGIWLWLGYMLAGILACLLIVTIPFGVASFRLAKYSLWPFGRETVPSRPQGPLHIVGNIIWLLLFGWELAIAHLTTAAFLAITIVGLPFAWANIKLIPLALFPYGFKVVSSDQRGLLVDGEHLAKR